MECNIVTKCNKYIRLYFLSPCRKWHKKESSPRNHSNAEVLRPRLIAMSRVLRPRVYSNVHSRFTHDLSRL